jgi:hypothetical protein
VHFRAAMLIHCSVAALALGACKARISNENLKVVNHEFERSDEMLSKGAKDAGVSPKEVESILGPPMRIESHRLPLETQKKEVDVVRYYYEQDGQTLELHFFDNKLIAKVPLLKEGAKATPEAKP